MKTTRTFDCIFVEIGDREHLAAHDAFKTGRHLRDLMHYTEGPVSLMVGGYDDDPRSLFHIPEVAEYVRCVMAVARLRDWRRPEIIRFRDPTLCLLVLCGVFADDHPFKPQIVDGAPSL